MRTTRTTTAAAAATANEDDGVRAYKGTLAFLFIYYTNPTIQVSTTTVRRERAYKVRSHFLLFLLYLLILITTDDAAPVWGSHRLRARRDTRCHDSLRAWRQTHRGCLCMLDAVPHPLSMETDPLQVSLRARCHPHPLSTETHLRTSRARVSSNGAHHRSKCKMDVSTATQVLPCSHLLNLCFFFKYFCFSKVFL